MESRFGLQKDIFFMKKALEQAQRAYKKDEVPIGAVVVNPQWKIVSRGHNLVETRHTQLAHAEALALEKAGKKTGDWRLEGFWLYVTLEPCSMCMSLMILSRLEGIVFGVQSPLFGYHLDKKRAIGLYKKDVIKVVEGVCAQEAGSLLKSFFKNKREKKGA